MKKFFTIKRIIYLSIDCVSLLMLVLMLIFPVDLSYSPIKYYSTHFKSIGTNTIFPSDIRSRLLNPFTFGNDLEPNILLAQSIVFPIVSVIFLVFLVLLLIELIKSGVFKRTPRPPKSSTTRTTRRGVGTAIEKL